MENRANFTRLVGWKIALVSLKRGCLNWLNTFDVTYH